MPSSAIRRCVLAGTVAGHGAGLSSRRRCWRCSPRGRRAGLGLAAWLVMALPFQPMLRFYRRSPLWGLALPAIGAAYTLFTVQSAIALLARPRRPVEGPRPGHERATHDGRRRTSRRARATATRIFRSPRGSCVPSCARRSSPSTVLRAPPTMSPTIRRPMPAQKLRAARSAWRQGCAARPAPARKAIALRASLQARGSHGPPCARSPGSLPPRRHQAALRRLGRAHGLLPLFGGAGRPLRARPAWRSRSACGPLNDALCAALQVINHLQDCAKDYRELDRVYIPLDALADARRWRSEALADRQAVAGAARRDRRSGRDALRALLDQSRPFAERIADRRLALEVGVIQALAESLAHRLDAARSAVASASIIIRSKPSALALRGALGVAVQAASAAWSAAATRPARPADDRRARPMPPRSGRRSPAARSTPPCA